MLRKRSSLTLDFRFGSGARSSEGRSVEPPEELDVVIIGAGLAGLRAAVALQEAGDGQPPEELDVVIVGAGLAWLRSSGSAGSGGRALILSPSLFHTHRAPRGAGRGGDWSRAGGAVSSSGSAGNGRRAGVNPLTFPLHCTPSETPEDLDVVIVGAGLAGLPAALALQDAGVPWLAGLRAAVALQKAGVPCVVTFEAPQMCGAGGFRWALILALIDFFSLSFSYHSTPTEPPEELDVVVVGAGLAGLRAAVALQDPPEELDVVIIGAGLAGLRAAVALQEGGVAFVPPEELDVVIIGAGLAGLRAAVALQEGGVAFVPPEELDVVIIGAGLAGLRAAVALQEAGVPCVVLEASDGVGGRVRTDQVDGFLLDRGFQIFLSAYPEAQQVMDYEALDLRPFYSGALVWFGGSFHRVADPFRHTSDGLSSLFNPIGSFFDKLRVGLLRLKTVTTPVEGILSAPESSIEEALKKKGFSNEMIDRFFRPFLGGIFFDNDLTTSSRLMEFVLRMLALAPNTLPSSGIGALASHLTSRLPSDSIRLNSPVSFPCCSH
ncbi:unnamed protein product [Closterium sp. Yama58-4]|nr:unnamed protein product [Closterium sp. Yama58-4]